MKVRGNSKNAGGIQWWKYKQKTELENQKLKKMFDFDKRPLAERTQMSEQIKFAEK